MHTRSHWIAAPMLALGLLGGGLAISRVAQADVAVPAAPVASSAPASGGGTSAPDGGATPTRAGVGESVPALPAPTPGASASATPTPSSSADARQVVMEECFLSDAEIQARYPGVTAETTTSKAGTETIWRLEGRYVGQSINGKGMTALCPVS